MRNPKAEKAINLTSVIGIRFLIIASAVLGGIMVLFAGYSIYEQLYTQNRAFDSGMGNFETEEEIIESQQNLSEEREDYRAWIRITDTKIDYPVMQGKDDLYYANHDVDGNSSLTGAVYMAAANQPDMSDDYIMLYGHHMDNGAMFGGLDKYLEKDYFDGHRNGILASPKQSYKVLLFAALKTDAYNDMIYKVGSRDLNELVKYISEHAVINYDIEFDENSQIIALSTCADATTNGRLVVFGLLLPDDSIPEPQPTPPPVTPTPPEKSVTKKTPSFWERFLGWFTPGGCSYGLKAWALLNLICLIVTIYIVIPLGYLKAKFGRAKKMRAANQKKEILWDEENLTSEQKAERSVLMQSAILMHGYKSDDVSLSDFRAAIEKRYYHVTEFVRKFRIGMILECVVAILAIIAFILTEDLRLPMTVIDRWTPLMLLLLAGCWIVEVLFARYHHDSEDAAPESDKADA